jgi:hypothetical protein
MKPFSWLFLALAAALFALPESARYVPVRDAHGALERWQRDRIPLLLVLPTRASAVNRDEALRAAQSAAAAWHVFGAPRIVVTPSRQALLASEDGVNVILFRADGWFSQENPEHAYDSRQDALTHTRARRSTGRDGGAEIIEADVEINAQSPYFSAASASDFGPRLQALLTHEFGHVLGLDHDCSASALSLVQDSAGEPRPSCVESVAPLRGEAMFPGSKAHELPVLRPTEQELTGLATAYRSPALERLALRWPRRVRALLILGLAAVLGLARSRSRSLRHRVAVTT